MRSIKFRNGFWYHVFNRGVDKRSIFYDLNDYNRFLLNLVRFNTTELVGGRFESTGRAMINSGHKGLGFSAGKENALVNVVCYCLNKNHYHLLLQQRVDNGIPKFMHKIGMGYAKPFNRRKLRSGALYQGAYRAVYVRSLEQLRYLSAYINGNAEIHGICPVKDWQWSSYHSYLDETENAFLKKLIVLDEFASVAEYREYVREVIVGAKKRKKELKGLLLE